MSTLLGNDETRAAFEAFVAGTAQRLIKDLSGRDVPIVRPEGLN